MISINRLTKYVLFVLVLSFSINGISQEAGFWTKLDAPKLANTNQIQYRSSFKNFDTYSLNKVGLINALENTPFRFSSAKSTKVIQFPDSQGNLESFTMFQTEVMSPALASKFPDIKTYVGVSQNNPSKILNLTITPIGVYVMIQNNGDSVFINPLSYQGNTYMLFNKSQAYTDHLNAVACEVESTMGSENSTGSYTNDLVDNTTLKRFRLALACTGEYADFHLDEAGVPSSATDQLKRNTVLAAMVVTINRINSIYEKDLAVNLQLIDNNEDLIQFIAATDPYSNNNSFAMLDENQDQVDLVIGPANYDIGHVFGTGGGGIAFLGSVCNANSKAGGVTGLFAPVGDPFDIDYVAHEIGHQFGANHTFNNLCGGARNGSTAVETGSGSTIMAYANICPPNVQSASDDYFHIVSINEIYNYINSGGGANCSENIGLSNNPPTIDEALQDYIIPTSTAFFLEVEASDADGDILSYTWEQLDEEISIQPPNPFNNSGPNFRSRQPTLSPRRYFPELNTVLNGSLSTTWEVIPNFPREMEFAVLVRDNNLQGGQSAFDTTNISFVSGGPFEVTSQNTDAIVWEGGTTENITWNVASTNNAPVNAPEVDILLSTNGGQDFDLVLAAGIPNNGSADILVPNVIAGSCRLLVKGSNSIFYAVNAEDFVINSDIELECFEEVNTDVVSIPDGINTNEPGDAVSSTIDFTENIVIESIRVQIDVTHTYIEDLVIQLVGPDDEFVTLFDRECSGEGGIAVEFNSLGAVIPDDCSNPLTGVFQPSNGNLDQWIGTNSEGEWTLLIQDFWDDDTGQLNSWSLELCTSSLSTISLEANRFSIVPNPNAGNFQVNFSSLSGLELSGKLYNVQGKLIENVQLRSGLLRQQVQFENLQQGMYLFQINDGDNTFVEKIIIR
jgi:subtilisin-like proprotein convertase family protein